jgi:hypothetical protein
MMQTERRGQYTEFGMLKRLKPFACSISVLRIFHFGQFLPLVQGLDGVCQMSYFSLPSRSDFSLDLLFPFFLFTFTSE